jgi:hypothetical protein
MCFYTYFFILMDIYIKTNMRKKLQENEKKVKITITLDREINKLASEKPNKSKYIENLIYNDLLKNNKINTDFML